VSERAKTDRAKRRGGKSFSSRLVEAGPAKACAVTALVALALMALGYWQVFTAADAANDSKRAELKGLRKQNAIARTVEETRPALMEEYRKAKAVYASGRELLPTSTELSRVMSAVQMIARKNGVRITVFDASALGGKSSLDAGGPQPPPPPAPTDGQSPPQAVQADPKNALKERVIPIQVIGRHSAVMNFFREVAAYVLIIHARDPKIQSLGGQESVNVKLVAFEAPPTSALPADPPDLETATLASRTGGVR
jgi:Tfp pilus assembly protein PilO